MVEGVWTLPITYRHGMRREPEEVVMTCSMSRLPKDETLLRSEARTKD